MFHVMPLVSSPVKKEEERTTCVFSSRNLNFRRDAIKAK